MSLFPRRFRRYFNELVDHAYRVLMDEDFVPVSGLSSFVDEIRYMRSELVVEPLIERSDLVSEVIVIWLRLRDKWLSDERLQSKPLGHYVSGFAPWALRDRLEVLLKPYRPAKKGPLELNQEPPTVSLNADLRFLMFGSNEWPWSTLGTYERNLLYLYVLKDLSMNQMAKLLQKDRIILGKTVLLIEERMRRLGDASYESDEIRGRVLEQTRSAFH